MLDDNRELFITETNTTVRAHPRFVLLATQNPAGLYGGRKRLSRAFVNRFVQLRFGELPSEELQTILHTRCALPTTYAQRMVAVMHDLQVSLSLSRRTSVTVANLGDCRCTEARPACSPGRRAT